MGAVPWFDLCKYRHSPDPLPLCHEQVEQPGARSRGKPRFAPTGRCRTDHGNSRGWYQL